MTQTKIDVIKYITKLKKNVQKVISTTTGRFQPAVKRDSDYVFNIKTNVCL